MNEDKQLLDQKLAKLFGQPPELLNEKKLSPGDKKIIEQGAGNLFFGLAWTNWLNGGVLGSAWQKALNQMDSFIKTKNTSNPAVRYTREVADVGRARMSKVAMTNPCSNEEIGCPKEKFLKWAEIGAKWTNEGLSQLNTKLKEFEPIKKSEQQAGQNLQEAIVKAAGKFKLSEQKIMELKLKMRSMEMQN
ncbi:MAG: hypothetical protein JW985_03320 [Alphaproteobacteria bacterium]|nr:hypothetical protein [Alphaproteobacteria bacterium]